MTTTLHPLRCHGCGASVPVEQGQRYVDCAYCHSRLEIIAPTHETSAPSIPEHEARKLRDELRDLDEKWNRYFDQMAQRDQKGVLQGPDSRYVSTHLTGGLAFTGLSSLCLALMTSPWWMALTAPLGLWLTRIFVSAAKERKQAFDLAQSRYYFKRDELLAKLGAGMGVIPR